jgi:hypothetical protein
MLVEALGELTGFGTPPMRYETKVECRDRILKDVRKQFESYWLRVAPYLERLRRDADQRGYRWLGKFQSGQSYRRIQCKDPEARGLTISYIRKVIEETAIRLNEPLRPSRTKPSHHTKCTNSTVA